MSSTGWSKKGDSWFKGGYEVRVTGTTSTGRPCVWGIYKKGKAVKETGSSGRIYGLVYNKLKLAKLRVDRLIESKRGVSVFSISMKSDGHPFDKNDSSPPKIEILVVPGQVHADQVRRAYNNCRPWSVGHIEVTPVTQAIFSGVDESNFRSSILPSIVKGLVQLAAKSTRLIVDKRGK